VDATITRMRRARPARIRARTRPETVIADRAYSAAAYRAMLHKHGITVVMPQKSDQIAARKRRGREGGRPPGLDVEACKGRNVAERSFALARQWRALATRYDKLAITYRAAVVLSATTSTSFPRT